MWREIVANNYEGFALRAFNSLLTWSALHRARQDANNNPGKSQGAALLRVSQVWDWKVLVFSPQWVGPKAFPATPFQVNTPSSLKLCFSFTGILLHVGKQYGSRKKGFGPNNAVWLEMLSLCRFGIKINSSGRGLLVLAVH